jgi:hypothetical protein
MRLLRLLIGTFVTVGLAVVLVASPVYAQPAFEPGLARAIEVQERHTDNLLGIQGVVGTAVGLGAGGNPVVKIYTEERGVPGLPKSLEGIPVVVQVTGKILALHHRPGHSGGPGGGGEDPPAEEPLNPTSRFPRPVPIGVSTGHPDITAGTIGARVTDGTDVYALSNNHVYADENQANPGDAVIQPGTFDGGSSPADDIGTLQDFEPIVFSTFANNVIDAAIASTTTALLGNSTPSDGYGTPESATATVSINQRVQKYGRTTGLTSGRVDAINATVNVGYSTGVARFVNQIVIRPGNFSAGGDSGSLVVARGGPDNRKPVGLLFAGSLVVTIANPIDDVLNTLGVTVDGQ